MNKKRGGSRKENPPSTMQMRHLQKQRKEAARSREKLRQQCRPGAQPTQRGALEQRSPLGESVLG